MTVEYKSVPVDKELYDRVKRMVKDRVKIWPSAYASGQVVTEYKRRGGKYRRVKKSSRKRSRKRSHKRTTRKKSGGSLDRWFKEDWRNVCKKTPSGKYAKCGRSSASLKGSSYPYCRPLRRVSPQTPKSISEMTTAEKRRMCGRKKRSMTKSKGRQTRVYVKNKRKPRKRTKSRKRTMKRKTGGRKSSTKRSRSRSHYKLPSLPRGTKFEKGPGRYKYTAILPDGKRVNFGHRDYQHFRDRVPKNKGGKLWSHKDHNDKDRMENYRSRHRGVKTRANTPAYKKKYSPSWFSYHFLW